MTDATDTADQTAVETPSGTEVETTEQQEQGLLAEGEATEGEEKTTDQEQTAQSVVEDELEEFEHAGKKLRISKEARPLLMMQEDYTRKTQELAEQRRVFDTEKDTFSKSTREQITAVGRIAVLDDQIAQYGKVDWQTLQNDDPLKAQSAWMAFQQIKDQRNDLVQFVQHAEQQRHQQEQNAFANRYSETTAEMSRHDKNWKENAPKVADFARRSGVTQEELLHIATNPRLSKLLHAAWLGNEIAAKQQQAAAKAKQAPPKAEPTPLKQVSKGGSGKPPTQGLHDDLSTEEWVKRREAQLRKTA